jgi:hypothetical protein
VPAQVREHPIEDLTKDPAAPQPLQYAGPQTPPSLRWRPVSLMIASGFYCVLLIAACYKAAKLKQVFSDFKVEIPTITRVVLSLSGVIWGDYVWIILLPLSILWPLILVQFLPVPEKPETRRKIVLRTRTIVVVIYLITIATVAYALFAPMIVLIQSVSGP